VRQKRCKELAELTNIPVVTTLMARGAFPDDHPLCLGMPGMHGNYTAVTAMQESDLLIALGSRFDDRVTGKLPSFAPHAKIIHVDIDPAELGKVRRPDVPIVGDARLVIEELNPDARRRVADGQPDRSAWRQTLSGWQEKFPLSTSSPSRVSCSSRSSCSNSSATVPEDTIVATRASASTRCGRRSTGSSVIPTPGCARVASAPWGSPSPPRSAPRSACPSERCGRSTATAASR
jgi:acetolactate synthase-1/2/3 large subunit